MKRHATPLLRKKKEIPTCSDEFPCISLTCFYWIGSDWREEYNQWKWKSFLQKRNVICKCIYPSTLPFYAIPSIGIRKKKRKEKQNNGKPDDVLHYHSELRSCVISDYIRPLLEVYYNLMLREGAHPQWDCVNSEMARHNITKR